VSRRCSPLFSKEFKLRPVRAELVWRLPLFSLCFEPTLTLISPRLVLPAGGKAPAHLQQPRSNSDHGFSGPEHRGGIARVSRMSSRRGCLLCSLTTLRTLAGGGRWRILCCRHRAEAEAKDHGDGEACRHLTDLVLPPASVRRSQHLSRFDTE
jgi:hypothetical protein